MASPFFQIHVQERLDVFVFHIILLGRLDFKAVSCRHLSRRYRIRQRICLNWNRFLNRLLISLFYLACQ